MSIDSKSSSPGASVAEPKKIDLHWDETPEEKHERINKILEERTKKPVVCVSCNEVVADSDLDKVISTPYGPYHGAPFTCVDGRDDDDLRWDQK